MSKDQLQDVFPINFQFVKGEQPGSQKFTGWVKQTDTAFSRIARAVGDPWEYQAHIHPLSPEKLAQTSISRFSGPSDWVSPQGSCWNESSSAEIIYLAANRNTWSLGAPLVQVTSTLGTDSNVGSVTPITWGVDIYTFYDPSGVLATEVSSLDLVTSSGEFHINYYTGVITTYSTTQSHVILAIGTTWNPMGPGVPWGTSNVIPTWDQSYVCTVTENPGSPSGGYSTYTISFPIVTTGTRSSGSRVGSMTPYGEGSYSSQSEVLFNTPCTGYGALYRLPYSLTSGFSADEEIPEGYMYLWDEGNGRIYSQITFYYIDENSIKVVTPENWLTLGTSVRILVSGTSLAEAVHYTMSAIRDNRHIGLTGGQDTKTLAFTSPLSHDHLVDRFSGDLLYSMTDKEKFEFRESSYPINPHPQYIHRSGWMPNDSQGNSANSMRGYLVFAGTDTGFPVGEDGDPSGCEVSTYGIRFGGTSSGTTSSSFTFEGGNSLSTWVSGTAHRLGFGIRETGSCPVSSEIYGATVHTSRYGTPLYLRGRGPGGTDDYRGSVLGFDLSTFSELNYIKLLPGFRSGNEDYPHMPANTGQSSFGAPITQTPNLSNRLSQDQVREFRFRGGAYLSAATNTTDSLGGTNTQGSGNEIPEFQHHFTSPGMVGADFFNVYSNYIFFSEQGDGRLTSFTEDGSDWMTSGTVIPAGISYKPAYGGGGSSFEFVTRNEAASDNMVAARFAYDGQAQINCTSFTAGGHGSFSTGALQFSTISLIANSSLMYFSSAGDMSLLSSDEMTIRSANAMSIQTTGTNQDITISSSDDVWIDAAGTGPIARIQATDSSPSPYDSQTSLTLRSNITFSIEQNSNTNTLLMDFDDVDVTRLELIASQKLALYGNGHVRLQALHDSITPANNNGRDVQIYAADSISLTADSAGTISNAAITMTAYTNSIVVGFGGIDLTVGSTDSLDFFVNPTYGNMHITGLLTGGGTALEIEGGSNKIVKGSSSRRYKEDIRTLKNVSWIYDLKASRFNYKSSQTKEVMYGFVAEEVYEVHKNLVILDKEGRPDSLKNNSIIAGIVKVLQQQKQEIESLKEELDKKSNKRNTKK